MKGRKTTLFLRVALTLALMASLIVSVLPVGKASAIVAGAVVVPNPATAGSSAQYTITFATAAGEALAEDVGTISVTFPTGTTVPATIAASTVAVNGTLASATGAGSPPTAPLVSGRTVTITVPVAVAAATAGHTLVFAQAAGILNPTAATTTATVSMNSSAAAAATTSAAYVITRTLTLSPTSGSSASSVSFTGVGYTAGSTVTVWIDTDDDGVIDAGEVTLAQATADAANAISGTFSVGLSFTIAGNPHPINAIDGSGGAVPVASNPTYTLRGTVSISPTSAVTGAAISITLSNYPAATAVGATTLGGVAVAVPAGTTTSAAGGVTFATVVPAAVPAGLQTLSVTAGAETRTTTFTVATAPVTATPSTVVPNQAITVNGSGFTTGGAATIAVGTATLAGVALTAAQQPVIAIDNGGNWVSTITIPVNATTLTAGTYPLVFTDTGGRIGTVDLTVPSRVMSLDPATSARGTTVTFNATGFAASSTVTVTYAGVAVASATADSAGAASGTFSVPLGTAIPSANTVTGTSALGGTRSATHSVPSASITLSATTAAAGTNVTVTGAGFPAFSPVAALTIGGVAALPAPAPATDVTGAFSATVLVPQLAAGTQPVVATAGGVTASASIAVTAAVQQVAVTTAFAGLTTAGTLNAAFGFDYSTGLFTSFVPGVPGNTFSQIQPNTVIFLTVTVQTTVRVSGVTFTVRANTPTPIPVGAALTFVVVP
ncbi:MAG: hypothetical protein HYX97_03530 [Chloroflexi bacterium]|nr:hypothetical protein [Chloroflexota bacterium]